MSVDCVTSWTGVSRIDGLMKFVIPICEPVYCEIHNYCSNYNALNNMVKFKKNNRHFE